MEPDGEAQGRALLVSGALGVGHEVTTQICAASLAARGWSARTVDAMRLLGPRAGGAGEHVFRSMLAVPGLYDAFYFAALRPGTRLARLADAGARRQLVPQLTEYLDRHPADLAISVFATGASAISAIAARYPALKHVVFCLDATPHRLWVHPHVDMYLVTSHVAECAVRRFQPEARVRIVPPPVRAAFHALPSQAAARDMFGVPGGAPAVLLMSGGWGLGPVAATAAALADAGIHVLAVAGRNTRMAATLRAAAVQRPRIRAFGYTDRVQPGLYLRRGPGRGPAAATARRAARPWPGQLPAPAGTGERLGDLRRPRRRGAHRSRRAGGTGTGTGFGGPGRHDRPGARPARLGSGLLRRIGRAGFRLSAARPLAARFAACVLPAAPPTC
jgi:UDP-N-acetylglucosamine:LPS N-acetylglucosamine transferase